MQCSYILSTEGYTRIQYVCVEILVVAIATSSGSGPLKKGCALFDVQPYLRLYGNELVRGDYELIYQKLAFQVFYCPNYTTILKLLYNNIFKIQ